MPISNIGVKFIKKWEHFEPKAYLDQAGIWTIGYGTTEYFGGGKVMEGDTIDEGRATMYLIMDCDGVARKITHWMTRYLQQNKLDALISLSYNIGTYGFRTSTLLKEINNGNNVIEDYFTRWDKVHIDGQLVESNGLKNRREAEWQLYSKGIYNVST